MEIEPIYLFDKNKELIDIIPYEDLLANSQDWTLNGLIKGTVTGIYTESIEQAHFYGTRDIDDPNVFWQYKIVNYTKENGQFTFEGIYVLFDDLAGRGVIRDRRPQNATISTVMEYILEDTGWQLGQVQSTHKGTSNYYYVSKLEAFWDFIEKWRVEFKPRMTFSNGKVTGKYIDIYDRLSDDYGKWYEYGDSLLTVVAEEMRESVFTAFIGRGKGEEVGDGFGRKIDFSAVNWSVANDNPVDKPIGQDYVEIPWATDLYGYEDGTPRLTVVDFPDIEDAAELLESTYEYALTECRPKVQFKSSVLENGRADIGEIVTILRPDMGIRYKTRVFNLKRDFLNVAIKTIQFGEQLVQSTAQRTKKTATAIKKQEEQTVYWLEMLRQAIVDSYFNEDGYNYDLDANNEYDLPGGYYSFDRPIDQNPTKVVYMGAGKILIANSKNPDGTWDWRTAMTGDGITLDAVNTGVLTAGRIQSSVDDSYWDLDNGLMDLKGGVFRGNRIEMDLDIGRIISEALNGKTVKIDNGEVGILSGTKSGKVDALGMEISDSSNGQKTRLFSDGLQFDWYSVIRQILQNSEGLTIKPISGSGNRLNSSLHLVTGPGDDKVAYLELGIPDQENGNARMQLAKKVLSIRHPNEGELIISDYNFDGSKGLARSGTFRTNPVDGAYLEMVGKEIKTVREGNNNIFLTPSGNGGVRVGSPTSNELYPITALSFVEGSNRDSKTNIKPFEEKALNIVNDLVVTEYNLKIELERGINQRKIGFIAEDSPAISAKQSGSDKLGVDHYKMTAIAIKAIQELDKENDILKQELAELKAILSEKGLI